VESQRETIGDHKELNKLSWEQGYPG